MRIERTQARWFALAPIALGPLVMGGEPGWSVGVIAASALFGFLAVLLTERTIPRLQRLDGLVLGAVVLTAFQLVPVPLAVLEYLAPNRLVAQRSLELAGSTSAWAPLTLDPGATMEALLVTVGVASAYFAARLVSNTSGGQYAIVVTSASAVGLLVTAGAVHEVLALDQVWGTYLPAHRAPNFLTPLTNNNHLSGVAALGGQLFVILALHRRTNEVGKRVCWVFGAVCVAVCLIAVSRGGVLGLLLGFAWIVWCRRGSTRSLLVPMLGAGAAVAAYVGLGALQRDFLDSDFTKLEVAGRGLELVASFPVLGVGRGAFGSVFASLEGTTSRFLYPENIVVQWGSEWGVPFTLFAIAVIGRLLYRTATDRGTRSTSKMLAGVVAALLVHDLVDYALELLPIAMIAVGMLATLLPREKGSRRRRGAWGTWGVFAAVVCVLAPGVHSRRPDSLVRALRSDFEGDFRDAVRLHPLDASILLWVAHEEAQTDPRRALRWLNRSMELAPGWASPHAMAADALWRLGARDQALLELREATTLQPSVVMEQLCGYSAVPGILSAVPLSGPQRLHVLEGLGRCTSGETRDEVDQLLLTEAPGHPDATRRTARARSDAGDVVGAIGLLETSSQLHPANQSLAVALSELYVSRAEWASAAAVLDRLPPTSTTSAARAELLAAQGDAPAMREEIGRLRGLASGSARKLLQAALLLASLEEDLGNQGAQMRALEEAHRLAPREHRPLVELSRLAREMDQLGRALTAESELCSLGQRAACARRDRLLERTRGSGQRRNSRGAP